MVPMTNGWVFTHAPRSLGGVLCILQTPSQMVSMVCPEGFHLEALALMCSKLKVD